MTAGRCLRAIRHEVGERPFVVIIDEFPWAVESDAGLPSISRKRGSLFQDSQIKLLISGSHISAMEKLLL
jgi:hypothetical protein